MNCKNTKIDCYHDNSIHFEGHGKCLVRGCKCEKFIIGSQNELDMIRYLKMDIELLYGILGRKFYKSQEKILEGKKIIKDIDGQLFQKICNELEFCKNKAQFSYMNTKSLAILLFNSLEDIPYKGSIIPKILLAVILVKMGLSRFCRC